MSKPQYETYEQPQYEPYGAAGAGYDPYRPAYGYDTVGAADGPATQMFTAGAFEGAGQDDRAGGYPGGPAPARALAPGAVDELPTRAFTPDAFPPRTPTPDATAVPAAGTALPQPRRGGGRRADGRAGARRAARRRRGGERPDGLRRLVPQALVVAFLAGGTSAFVANDKAVQLSVDGRSRTLHTFADDVGELLADEGVDIGAHDIVAPAAGTALTSGDEIAVRYGRPVELTLDGQRRNVWTTARTVDGALRQLGVRAEGAYLSASRGKRIAREGLDLDVRTERTVTVMADGRSRTVRTNAATVGEVVEESGVTLRGSDTTSVPASSFPRDGQTVTVMRISGREEVREEPIPYAVHKSDDASLPRGTEVVAQAGREGARRITYSVRTVNGVRQRPKRLRSEVVREPQTRIVKVGTKVQPTAVAGAEGLNWGALAACESGGRPGAVDASGTYGGLYQFDTRTWQSLGGSGRPQDAPAAEQTHRAKKLYVQRGASPWPHCGGRL
ncbi:resuscitation-promoting factor [Streptomyces silvensis]|uniref:Transglycosylase n=1 Tax=Streptomyces silvensis TaxID=1765722 RepID=A0A0W7X9H0_9ACTN|nr:resuscitation-promoting factor [Streptomyces silvensis]KUF19544.1 transglycosylase [Streptomyces silvensis]